ncbi:hypothetical protein HZH68_001838 [Vespula germanica]|uniref:Uncharacterized protein n=1 Tax=Vespula germanica TaxID=30212 RepID=A0A834KSP7_VESGE|nr:hypothetical protein HZH68_001838 [Vespula germanica]
MQSAALQRTNKREQKVDEEKKEKEEKEENDEKEEKEEEEEEVEEEVVEEEEKKCPRRDGHGWRHIRPRECTHACTSPTRYRDALCSCALALCYYTLR